jgi:hypothetical protein
MRRASLLRRASLAVALLSVLGLAATLACTKDSGDILREAAAQDPAMKRQVCYSFLDGLARDEERGLEWCRSIAAEGDTNAQVLLGEMYLLGRPPVERDYAEALRWFEAAASAGHAHAQYRLGTMYANGLGVEEDPDTALEWYRLSAAQKYSPANEALAELAPRPEEEAAARDGCAQVSRATREALDDALRSREISGVEWACRVQALDRLDRELAAACSAGEPVEPLLESQTERMQACRPPDSEPHSSAAKSPTA